MAVINGVVYDGAGAPAAGRIVRLYRRDTGALLGSAVTSDGVTPTILDPYYDHVSLLLDMNGADGSTTFTDLSPSPKTVTVYGNTKISTAQSKFGGSSAYFDGSGDYLEVSGLPVIGTGDYTLEAWVSVASATSFMTLLDLRSYGAQSIALYVGSGGYALSVANNANVIFQSASVPAPLNGWFHTEVVRSAGVVKGYINGVLVGSVSDSRSLTGTAARIGISNAAGQAFTGYVGGLRITNAARHTANFVPPAGPFETAAELPAAPVGSYGITTAYTGEVQRIVLDDDAGTLYNDLIDRVIVE